MEIIIFLSILAAISLAYVVYALRKIEQLKEELKTAQDSFKVAEFHIKKELSFSEMAVEQSVQELERAKDMYEKTYDQEVNNRIRAIIRHKENLEVSLERAHAMISSHSETIRKLREGKTKREFEIMELKATIEAYEALTNTSK